MQKPIQFVPMASSGDDLDTVWYDFSGGAQGWSFLNSPNVVQVYYPDASCEQQWRIDTTSYYSSLSPATFLGETSLRYYVNFHGYYSNSCSYNWWIKSCISPGSDDWNEVFKIQARVYIDSSDLQYVMIGVKMEGDDGFTYYGWGSPLSAGTWHTISLTEPSSGAFADLEAVSILAGGYSTQSNLYIDYVRGIKNISSAPNLVSPTNGATTEDNLPAFSWSGDGDHYSLQIATDAAFQDIVVDSTDINGSNCTVTTPLPFSDYTYTPAGGPHDPNYYWRVRAHYTSAGVSPWSSARTLVVNGPHEVPSEFPTIREASNALPMYIGGTVIVHPGTYTGLNNCQVGLGGEKPVDIIASSGDPSQTIIDGQNTYYGFTTDLYTV
ncbi:hypothetical protein GF356_03515, partial [candidate division GN15 bacterium]|nr:hypothetical protein [candidate division GN15 bacterium]